MFSWLVRSGRCWCNWFRVNITSNGAVMSCVSRVTWPGSGRWRVTIMVTGTRATFLQDFARDEQVIFREIFIFNSLIFCTWHQWTDNLRTAIIMKGSKSWSASHCINYVCNSFQQFRVWKYCVEISSTRTCAGCPGTDSRVQTLPATVGHLFDTSLRPSSRHL